MREIKFRGFTTQEDINMWVYGSLVVYKSQNFQIVTPSICYFVDPESVGQLVTMIGDKEVYEGDIYKYSDTSPSGKRREFGPMLVKYGQDLAEWSVFAPLEDGQISIVGNTYDNPRTEFCLQDSDNQLIAMGNLDDHYSDLVFAAEEAISAYRINGKHMNMSDPEIVEEKRYRVGDRLFTTKEKARLHIEVSQVKERLVRLNEDSKGDLPSFVPYAHELYEHFDLYIKAVRPDLYDYLCDNRVLEASE